MTGARTVAFERRLYRLAGTVAEAWRVERGFLAALPTPRPFIRFGDVDYWVSPGLSGRREQLVASWRDVVVFLDGNELARHVRSYVPADVVLDPAHARALRLARAATRRLQVKDVVVPVVNRGPLRRRRRGDAMSRSASELAFLARAMKAPRLAACTESMARRAAAEGWDHQAYLVAVLAEEVAAHETRGGQHRVEEL